MSKTTTNLSRPDLTKRVTAASSAAAELATAPPGTLGALLDAAAAELVVARDELVATADDESRLGVARLSGELTRTVAQLGAFATYVRSGEELDCVIEHLPAGSPASDLRRVNQPVGPVAVFGASNFPFAFGVPGGDTAAAWAARCPVVVKAHPAQPRTSELAAGCLRRAARSVSLPASILELVHGPAPRDGIALVTQPLIAAVAFTGSTVAGLALADAAARRPRPIPVFAEMGSVNPVVLGPTVLSGARLADTARALAASVVLGWGQFCTKPGVLLAPAEHAPALFTALAGEIEDVEPAAMLTPGIAASYAARVEHSTGLGAVESRCGRRATDTGPTSTATVALTGVEAYLREQALQQEHFGPFTLVVALDSPGDIGRVLDAVGGSLTGTVLGDADDPWVREGMSVLPRHVGRVLAAGVPTGVAVSRAQVHGGPFPAGTTTHTSVGPAATHRFLRPVAYQDVPDVLLPPALQDHNPWRVVRRVDGRLVPAPDPLTGDDR